MPIAIEKKERDRKGAAYDVRANIVPVLVMIKAVGNKLPKCTAGFTKIA